MECPSMSDRRMHERFKAPYNAFVVLHSDSIIVTSLADINMAGLAFDYKIEDSSERLEGAVGLDIFCADEDFYDFHLQNVPFEIVSKTKVLTDDKFHPVATRYGVRFSGLSPDQQARLRFFIKYHTIGDMAGRARTDYDMNRGPSIFDRLSFVF